jgi:hypothetical protein
MKKRFFMTAQGLFDILDQSLSDMIHKQGEKLVALRGFCKHHGDELEKRIVELEKIVKQLCCNETGHDYTKWERYEYRNWMIMATRPTHVIGTCEDCGHQKRIYPQNMKPSQKKMFIEMGILTKEDFPVEKKGK